MAVLCEDLAKYGVAFVPSGVPEFKRLYEDVCRSSRFQPEANEGEPVILVNRARVSIVTFALSWIYVEDDGRPVTTYVLASAKDSVLLPFLLPAGQRAFHDYWNTIFPGSKRLITDLGYRRGGSGDVRPPFPDEERRGGRASVQSGGWRSIEPYKVVLDGVFFADGGFAGPNELGLWERTNQSLECYRECGLLACDIQDEGRFFEAVTELTGCEGARPSLLARLTRPRDPEAGGAHELYHLGRAILFWRKHAGPAAATATVADWAGMDSPKLYRL